MSGFMPLSNSVGVEKKPATKTLPRKTHVCWVLVALGMNPNCESDKVRLDAALSVGYNLALSVNDTASASPAHIECDFKTERGAKSLGAKIQERLTRYCLTCSTTVDVVLDPMGLQEHYYKNRYGLNWVKKMQIITRNLSYASTFLLPEDKNESVKKMLAQQPFNIRSLSNKDFWFKHPFAKMMHSIAVTDAFEKQGRPAAAMQLKQLVRGLYSVQAK